MTSLKPGDVLASKYQLEEVIGRGGFATVYRARDLLLGRAVAVKLLELEREHSAARFVREAKILGELQDAHTMRLFDFGRAEDGTLFMVVELLGGHDLSDLLARRGTLNAGEAEHILRQVLSSLREAHAAGLLHRDIKPANIRVHPYQGDAMRVTLMDFGVARREVPGAAKLTATGARIGTAAYMPPEQAIGADVTAATDLFALGLVIAECLTGDLRVVRTAMMASAPFDFGARPQLARALQAMLELDVNDRVRSADAVLAILDGPAVEATPPSSPPGLRDAPSAGPHEPRAFSSGNVTLFEEPAERRWVGATGVAAAVLILVGAFAWGVRDRAPEPRRVPSVTVTRPPLVERPPAPDPTPPEVVADSANPGCGVNPADMTFDVRRTASGLDMHRWRRYLPKDYDATSRHPVLIAFHTDDGTARKLTKNARLEELADKHQMIVIAFEGPSPIAWSNMYPGAIQEVLEANRREVCIDPDRVFVLGYGAGGFPAEELSCEPWVAGVVLVSHRSIVRQLPCPETAKPLLFFHPTKSRHLPVAGGWNCSRTREHVSLAEQEVYLRRRNGCVDEPRTKTFEYQSSTCFNWDCKTPLEVCHVDGGHQFPGSGKRKIDLLKCDGPDPDFPYLDRFSTFLEPLLTSE